MSGPKDVGFADPAAVARELKKFRDVTLALINSERPAAEERRALIVRRQAELLVELLDQSVDDRRFHKAPVVRRLFAHHLKRPIHALIKILDAVFNRNGHRDLQGAERLDPRLRLAERIFELEHAFFCDHPDLPPRIAPGRMTAATGASSSAREGGAK